MFNLINKKASVSILALLITLESLNAKEIYETDLEPTTHTVTRLGSQKTGSFYENEPQVLSSHRPLIPASEQQLTQEENRHQPLVLTGQIGRKTISPFLKDIQRDLLELNDFAYSAVKGVGVYTQIVDQRHEDLRMKGWTAHKFFWGLEGKKTQFVDISGVVSYNEEKSLLAVTYHGTATINDGHLEGWATNFDAEPIYAGGHFPGLIHQGFSKKYNSTAQDLINIIRLFKRQMTEEQKKKLSIIFTGHSQGGATANLALYDTCANYGEELFGQGFNNIETPRMFGYFLSEPRVGNEDYANAVHQIVGEQNIVRQNVQGDPVPVALGNRFFGKALGWLFPKLKRISIYKDTGTLLLDSGAKIWKRMNTPELRKERWDYQKSVLISFISDQVNSFTYALNPIGFFKEIAEEVKATSLPFKAPRALWSFSKGFAKRALGLFRPGVKAIKDITVDALTTRLAHYHYGFNFRDDRGAIFDPRVVSATNLDSLITD